MFIAALSCLIQLHTSPAYAHPNNLSQIANDLSRSLRSVSATARAYRYSIELSRSLENMIRETESFKALLASHADVRSIESQFENISFGFSNTKTQFHRMNAATLNTLPSDFLSEWYAIAEAIGALRYAIQSPSQPLPPTPPSNGAWMEAECHIDDDSMFDYGQSVVGMVRGSTAAELIAECQGIAVATYGNNGVSGLQKLNVLSSDVDYVFATCEIDDDPQFDFGVFPVGKIAAPNFINAFEQCREIARNTYKQNGSAGIRNPSWEVEVPFLVTAVCHMDDDPQFDPNVFVFGRMRGRTVVDVTTQCNQLAKLIYGQNGSSGIQNIVQPRR